MYKISPEDRPRVEFASKFEHIAKRIFDVTISGLIILTIFPLLLVISLLIQRADGAPIIFRHKRIGRNGDAFYCFKFRTMRRDAEAALATLLENDPEARAEWEQNRKLRDDPRILGRVGAFLRKTSLDELPQLFNVLRGDMSLVGPRPVTKDELVEYGEHVTWYLAARPGLTGPWQISGRSDTTFAERVSLDVEYVKNVSVFRDIMIMLRTVPAVLNSRGAY